MYSPFIVEESREHYQLQIQTADEYRLAQQAQAGSGPSPRTGIRQTLVALWYRLATRLTRGLPAPATEEIW